jgi:dipeptidyl aminopeptidase/acylaminoacyl peptidase
MKQLQIRLLCAFACLLTAGQTLAADNRLTLEDVAGIVGVSDPQLSPDGKSIAFVVARPNLKDARYDRSLILVDVASGTQRTLTYGRRAVGSPRWSPTGDRLAFLDKAVPESDSVSHEPHTQVFVMPMSGGDAQRITNVSQDVEQIAWSPDGKQIAFVIADENPDQKQIEQHRDAFEVHDNDYLATEAQMPSHLWLVGADGSSTRRLTSGNWSLPKSAPPSPPASPLSWSPDGRSIAIVQQATPYWGDTDQSVLAIIDVASGHIRKLTDRKLLEGYPVFSADGAQISYFYQRDGDPNSQNDLWVTGSGGGPGAAVTLALDRDIVRGIWSADGKSLLVAAHDGTRVGLWWQPLGGPAKRIDLGNVDPSWGFWVDVALGRDGSMAFAGSTPNHPNEIYYLSAGGGAPPRRLTQFNQSIEMRDLGRAEQLEWKGPNGVQQDGVVIYPPGFDSSRKYPLVLLIHGGPQASSTTGYSSLSQLLASHGYVVFSPNYRGSDNLGNAFEHAIDNDAGEGPGRDVMTGLAALEHKGFIDESRIGVSGWSYGGYMTSWLIGHYHIWKAAVSGAAVNDLVHSYALSDNNVTQRFSINGPPWDPKQAQAYRVQSPITYARDIKTPTLILSDTGDARVPITQSYLMYHALKDNGVTVQFFAYPVPGHSPGDPVRQPDVFRRWVDWMDRYLHGAGPPTAARASH